MEKKTFCLILTLALWCTAQAFAAEPASEQKGGCTLTPARLGAMVEAPSLCAPEPERSPEAVAREEIFGNPETGACCTIAERNECYASCAPGCGHWYCDLVCICECLC